MATNAAFNPNNGQPLYQGQTTTFQGITYVGTTKKPANDPSNQYNTDTGQLNTNWFNYKAPAPPSPTPVYQAPAPVYAPPVYQAPTPTYSAPVPVVAPAPTYQAPAPVTPPPATVVSSANLQVNSSGQAVKDLQTQLKSVAPNLTIDGIFGPQTKSAVMKFQADHGLVQDGIVGPLTLAALTKAGSGASAPVTTPASTPATFNATTTPSYTVQAGDTFNRYNGQPLSNATPGTVINNPTGNATDPATFNQITNDKANAESEAMALELSKTNSGASVDTSASEKLLKSLQDLTTRITNPAPTAPASQAEIQATKRADLNIDPIETNLNNVDASIAKLKSDYAIVIDTETLNTNGLLLSQINRRKSAEQIKYEDQLNRLIDQRNSIANELSQKYSVLDSFMKYSSMDYENSVSAYNTQFSQTISLMNVIKGVQDDQKSSIEKAQDNAKANGTLIINSFKDSGVNIDSVDPTTKANWAKLSLQMGQSSNFLETLIRATSPAPVKATTTKPASPLSILDIQRYNELYPSANITAGDTEASANSKVTASNSPEAQTKNLITAAKDNGNSYETVVAEINSDATIKDKAGAKKIADEVYGKITPKPSGPISLGSGNSNLNPIVGNQPKMIDSISNYLFK